MMDKIKEKGEMVLCISQDSRCDMNLERDNRFFYCLYETFPIRVFKIAYEVMTCAQINSENVGIFERTLSGISTA